MEKWNQPCLTLVPLKMCHIIVVIIWWCYFISPRQGHWLWLRTGHIGISRDSSKFCLFDLILVKNGLKGIPYWCSVKDLCDWLKKLPKTKFCNPKEVVGWQSKLPAGICLHPWSDISYPQIPPKSSLLQGGAVPLPFWYLNNAHADRDFEFIRMEKWCERIAKWSNK